MSLQSFKRNVYNRLSKKERKNFYSNLNLRNVTDINLKNEITLIEGEKIISSDLEVANTINSCFENAVASLVIPQIDDHLIDSVNIRDPTEAIITKYSNHPSILKINKTVTKGTFNFQSTDIEESRNKIAILITNVSCPSGRISSSLLKDNVDICSEFLLNTVNFGITNSTFDGGKKFANVTPIFKTDESIRKENNLSLCWIPIF